MRKENAESNARSAHKSRSDPRSASAPRRLSWRTYVAAFSLALHAPLTVNADASPAEPPSKLIQPFVMAGPYVTIQTARASASTTLEIDTREKNTLTGMNFRFLGGLSGPEIAAIPGRPRPVITAAFIVPLNESSTIGGDLSSENLGGSGTRSGEAKYGIEYTNSYSAGLGLEFKVDVFDRELRLTPGIEYLNSNGRYVGLVEEKQTTILPELEIITRRARTKRILDQHLLGPSFRLSTEGVKIAALWIDFYVEGALLIDIAGTREKAFVDFGDADGNRASFNFEMGRGSGQINAGLQIRWP